MSESEIVSGQRSAWYLLKKLGEGDAGEVYLVESLIGAQTAILKRTPKSVFSGDIFRQSAQIRTEAKILKALTDALAKDPTLGIAVPTLLDQSKPGSEFNERSFIVIEKATGFDLGFLTRLTQLGLSSQDNLETLEPQELAFLNSISQTGKIPNRILITILHRLTCLLELIHSIYLNDEGSETWGIGWNDVKPDHIFWDPQHSLLTIIDWGNARFLDADRATGDRQFSYTDDYRQLYEEMGRILSVASPDLPARLGWHGQFSTENASPEGIEALKSRLDYALQQETQGMIEARADEAALLKSEVYAENPLEGIEAIHRKILSYGEIPDYAGALGFAASYAARLTMENRLDDLRFLCEWVKRLPGVDADQWRLVDFIAQIPGRSDGEQRQAFLDAIQAAICKDWESLLWSILAAIQSYPEPGWWQELTSITRRLALGSEGKSLRPLIAVSRFGFALQALTRHMEDGVLEINGMPAESPSPLKRAQALARILKEETITNWTQLDPGPPDSSLEYYGIENLLREASDLLPEEQRSTLTLLNHPKTQVKRILDAWGDKDFLEASKGLRHLLLWDPDRRRVLRADQAILAAPEYLKKVHLGPPSIDNFPEWITRLEFQGRELRNQVGPAGWLDAILESCKQIRKGVWPSDLFQANPEIIREMPWLRKFERAEKVPVLEVVDQTPEPGQAPVVSTVIRGIEEARLAPDGAISMIKPLDAWIPEARGSSARVVAGTLLCPGDVRREAAFKLMRMDKMNYALPLFREEVKVMSLMHDIPGVAHMLECGFVQLDEGAQYPLDTDADTGTAAGRVLRIGPELISGIPRPD